MAWLKDSNTRCNICQSQTMTDSTEVKKTNHDADAQRPNERLVILRDLASNLFNPPTQDNFDLMNATAVHDWRNYVPEEIRDMWEYLSEKEKMLVALTADVGASSEEWD